MTYDFSKLTLRQQELLTAQGWNPGSLFPMRQPLERTVEKMIARGLVVPHIVRWSGLEVMAYEVPIPVHMAWCEHCANMKGGE